MRIAIIADIHSNIYALKEAYKYIDRSNIDKIVVLGDLISDCPYPNRVMEFLYKWSERKELVFIKGNREEYLLDFDDTDELKENMESIKYTYDNLDKKYLNEFMKYSYTHEEKIEGKTLFFSHASKNNTRDLLYPNENNTKQYMDSLDADIIFCAHSHLQFIYYYNNKILVNPGTIGHFRENKKTANFSILEVTENKTEIKEISIPYETKELLKDFTESGLEKIGGPYIASLIYAYKTGVFFGSSMLSLGKELGGNKEDYDKAYRILVKRYNNGKRQVI